MHDPAPMTLESFLAWEAEQSTRHEFTGGVVYAMAGATKRHNRLVRRLANILERGAGDGCDVYSESVQLIAADSLFYPDVVLSCDERDADEADAYVVRYPQIIAEVLSPSNRGADMAQKLRAYTTLPTLQHFLLIEQTERAVIHYRFDSMGEGLVRIVREGALDVGFTIELDELYTGIRLGRRL